MDVNLLEELGAEPAILFGCEPPEEVVGPLRPKSCVYGVMTEMRGKNHYIERPVVNINVPNTDHGLPPWPLVREALFESQDGKTMTFIDMRHEGNQQTNDLKTVTLSAEHVIEGTSTTDIIGQ